MASDAIAAPRRARRKRIIWAILIVLMLGVAAGGLKAYHWLGHLEKMSHLQAVLEQMDWFVPLKDQILRYIKDNEGYIPADPYRGLIESGTVPGYHEFAYGEPRIKFEFRWLPVRISPRLQENRRFVLFRVSGPGPELWLCFSDGSWERWGDDEKWVYRLDGTVEHNKGASPWYDFQLQAGGAMRAAGYPEQLWMSLQEKRKWIATQRENLQWSDKVRMYVVQADSPPE